jgi:hypothetical protein
MVKKEPPAAAFNKFGDDVISKSVQVARANWADWQDVYEHGGPIRDNPLLADAGKFATFCREYSVGRTIRRGTRNELRVTLSEPRFSEAIQEDTGLDILENEFRPRFGTCNGTRRMTSLLSKVAAFVKPERFVAWDKYARKGLSAVMAGTAPFQTYAEYLAAFDRAWDDPPGQQVRDYLLNRAQNESEKQPRFQRRVLDVCLMIKGGRRSF